MKLKWQNCIARCVHGMRIRALCNPCTMDLESNVRQNEFSLFYLLVRLLRTRLISILHMRKTVRCHCNHIRIFMELVDCRYSIWIVRRWLWRWTYVCRHRKVCVCARSERDDGRIFGKHELICCGKLFRNSYTESWDFQYKWNSARNLHNFIFIFRRSISFSVLHAPCNQPKHPVCDPLLHKCTPAGINRRLMNLFVALRVEREFDFSLRTANASRAFHSIHIHCAVQRIFR